MRLTTALSIAVIGISTAALAQVVQAPVEQKLGNNMTNEAVAANDMAVAEDTMAAPPTNEMDMPPANTMDTPMGNAADAAPPAGEPVNTTNAPPKG